MPARRCWRRPVRAWFGIELDERPTMSTCHRPRSPEGGTTCSVWRPRARSPGVAEGADAPARRPCETSRPSDRSGPTLGRRVGPRPRKQKIRSFVDTCEPRGRYFTRCRTPSPNSPNAKRANPAASAAEFSRELTLPAGPSPVATARPALLRMTGCIEPHQTRRADPVPAEGPYTDRQPGTDRTTTEASTLASRTGADPPPTSAAA